MKLGITDRPRVFNGSDRALNDAHPPIDLQSRRCALERLQEFSRDGAGGARLAATTLKGRLRFEAEHLAQALAWKICAPPHASSMCHPLGDSPDQPDYLPCAVCQLFGSPWSSGKLYFEDLITPTAPILIRYQRTPHSRARGVTSASAPSPASLSAMALPAGSVLRGRIRHSLTENWQIGLLIASLRAISSFGGGYGIGWGRCRVEIEGVMDYSALAQALHAHHE